MREKPKAYYDECSLSLGKAIDSVTARIEELSFEDLVRHYEAIEAEFIPRVCGKPFLVLETKRRIAEAILIAATSKNLPFDICHPLFKNLEALGFSNTDRRVSYYMIFARYCSSKASVTEGVRLLESLRGELEAKRNVRVNQQAREIANLIRELKAK